jgi:hypothetical protein
MASDRSAGNSLFAIATEDGWVSDLTCGVSATPGGSEVFYPSQPLCTQDDARALTRRSRAAIERVAQRLGGWAAFHHKIVELTEVPETEDEGPYVCPGCYAVGGEPCAAYCVDAEIERERENDRNHRYDDAEEDDDAAE